MQLPDSQRFDTQMEIHTTTHNPYVSLEQGFQKHLCNESHRHGIVDAGKQKKRSSKQKWIT